jgi:hypothetical protein
MNREPFYALMKKQILQWQLINAGKIPDEESIIIKPYRRNKNFTIKKGLPK